MDQQTENPPSEVNQTTKSNYVSKDMVREAVNSLRQQNRKPTIAGIRKTIGKGSYTTISKWFCEIQKESAPATDTEEPEVSAVLAEAASRAVQELWELARNEVKKVYEKKIKELNSEIASFTENREELCKEIDILHEKIRTDGELIKESNYKLGEAQGAVSKISSENEHLRGLIDRMFNQQKDIITDFREQLHKNQTPEAG